MLHLFQGLRLVAMLDLEVNAKQSMRSTSGNKFITKERVVAVTIKLLAGGTKSDVAGVLGVSDTSMNTILSTFFDPIMDCQELRNKPPTIIEELSSVAGLMHC